jgi:hypothetical protein
MISVTAGTDTYGAVRKVRKTPIVTKFAMLELFPIFPIESYYLSHLGQISHEGIPLIYAETSRSIVGYRLARVDRLSAVVTYVRAIGAAFAVVGSIGLIFGIFMSSAERVNAADPVDRYIVLVSGLLLATAILIAVPTYIFTFVVPEREKEIREYCDDALGIAADPARLDSFMVEEFLELTIATLAQAGIVEPYDAIRQPITTTAEQKRLLLVFARSKIALGGSREEFEPLTDSLLIDLAHSDAAHN